jgi:hypothetical protein
VKRKWTVPVRDLAGQVVHIVIEVPPGGHAIYAAAKDRPAVALRPEDVSRLRQAFGEAQAVALYERGEW